jgi:hypothetical protein
VFRRGIRIPGPPDQIALKFTKELYNQLSNGVPLGEAVKISRLKCRRSGDPYSKSHSRKISS